MAFKGNLEEVLFFLSLYLKSHLCIAWLHKHASSELDFIRMEKQQPSSIQKNRHDQDIEQHQKPPIPLANLKEAHSKFQLEKKQKHASLNF